MFFGYAITITHLKRVFPLNYYFETHYSVVNIYFIRKVYVCSTDDIIISSFYKF